MKKIILLIGLIILIALISACSIDNMELSENIVAPKNTNLPIEGRYIIEDYKLSAVSGMDEEEAMTYIGKEAIFSEEMVSLGELYCYEPNFKIKNVKTNEYLIYQYKTNPETLNIEIEEIQIVSISGAEQFFNDFIKLSEDNILVNIDGVFFYLRKMTDNVEMDNIALYDATTRSFFEGNGIRKGRRFKYRYIIRIKVPRFRR